MSQTNDNGTPAEERDDTLFDEGFSLGENQNGNDGAEAPGEQPPKTTEEAPQSPSVSKQEPAEQPKAAEIPAAYVPPAYPASEPPQAMPQGDPAVPAPTSREPASSAVKTVEAPEGIADELETLKKLNPAAAALALEDSPEGASIRARLEQYGAELAQDRAERVLWQREQDQQREQAEIHRMTQAREAHNAAFMSTLQRDHPDYMAMLNDPARRAEAAQYQQDVFGWIASKPYSEAAQLMEIARSGRDPAQVSALLTQFKSERGEKPKRPDPTGALAVPGRGAPVAPAGVGDKDNFDAGWNLNPSK